MAGGNLERKARRKVQTRLNFNSSSPPAKAHLPTPAQSSQPPKAGLSSSRKIQPEPISLDSSDGSPEEDDDVITPSRSSTKAKSGKKTFSGSKPRRQKSITLSGDLSSEDEEEPTFPPPRKPHLTPKRTRPFVEIASSKKKQVVELSDDSEDELATTSSLSKTLRKKSNAPIPIAFEEEDSDEEPITSPLKRRRAVESDSGSDIVSSPMKRRRVPELKSGNEDVDEDDNNIDSDDSLPSPSRITSKKSQPPPATQRITRQQKTPKRHRTEKEKTFELLKRRRAGEKIEQLTDTESDSGDNAGAKGMYDTDDELEVLSEFEDEEESPGQVTKSKGKGKAKTKPKPRSGSQDMDDYDSDFVVDEEDGLLGVPDIHAQIPLEFTHAAHKPLKEHFRDAVEWMVHNKINPGFSRDDPVYRQAFVKLDYECQGLAKSKFISTQWTHEFTRTINARPNYLERPTEEGEGYDLDGTPKCDTCNHRKHIPTWAIQFTGKAYNKATLEPFEENSDASDNSDSESVSVDENDQELPSQDKEWFSGRTCRDNAQQAHGLIHWRYALNEWVVDHLENSGLLKPRKLAKRVAMTSKQRRQDANEIVDRWQEQDVIKKLYRDFKSILETARNTSTGGERWAK